MQNSIDLVLSITNLVVTSKGFYLTCTEWYLNDPESSFSAIYIAESIRDQNLIVSGSYQTLPWRSGSINWQIEFSYSCFTHRGGRIWPAESRICFMLTEEEERLSQSQDPELLGQNCNFSSINSFFISFADTVFQPACWDFAFFPYPFKTFSVPFT